MVSMSDFMRGHREANLREERESADWWWKQGQSLGWNNTRALAWTRACEACLYWQEKLAGK